MPNRFIKTNLREIAEKLIKHAKNRYILYFYGRNARRL